MPQPQSSDTAVPLLRAQTASGDDFRERIIKGAHRSIARHGLERSTIASVAREAGVSRQTVYAYYRNREELLRDAVTRSAATMTEGVLAKAQRAESAGQFLVEVVVGTFYAVREDPAISAMLYALDTAEGREMTMSPPILDIVVSALRPVVDLAPELEDRLEVLAETCLRLEVSLLTFPSRRTASPQALRSYLTQLFTQLVIR